VLDPYLLPNGTLQNRLGTDDPSELLRREDQLVSLRQAVLARKRSSAPFDFDKLGEIHRYLFQDVYEWAGKPRSCDLRKAAYSDSDESPKQFTPSSKIKAEADRIFGALIRNNELRGLSLSDFTDAQPSSSSKSTISIPSGRATGEPNASFSACSPKTPAMNLRSTSSQKSV
jgi:cell filamentation protein